MPWKERSAIIFGTWPAWMYWTQTETTYIWQCYVRIRKEMKVFVWDELQCRKQGIEWNEAEEGMYTRETFLAWENSEIMWENCAKNIHMKRNANPATYMKYLFENTTRDHSVVVTYLEGVTDENGWLTHPRTYQWTGENS